MTTTELPGRVDLSEHGIDAAGRVYRNPTTLAALHARARARRGRARRGRPARRRHRQVHRAARRRTSSSSTSRLARTASGGARSTSRSREEHFDGLRDKVAAHLDAAEALYVVDAWAGADPAHRIGVRVITAHPYHALFAKTMFIDLAADEQRGVRAAGARAARARRRGRPGRGRHAHAARSSCCTRARTELLVGGTFYAGEIKKSIFTVMNDRLPLEGVFPMHCSANVGDDGRVAVFFGLSGTGKTTLSADPERSLIGDDEHGWGDSGVFNIEGGCYAKVIRLSPEAEPEIFQTTQHVRDDPRERRRRRARACSTSTTTRRPRTRAPRTSSSRSRTRCPTKRAGHPSVGRSSSPPTRSGSCRRSRGSRATRRSTTSSPASRPSSPAPRSASPSRSRRSRRASAQPFLPQPPAVYARMLGEKLDEHGSTRLARQHRLDRRAVRRGAAHADPGDARRCCTPRSRASSTTSSSAPTTLFGFEVPVARPGRRRDAARPALDLARPGASTTRKARELARCSATTSRSGSATSTTSIRAAGPTGLMASAPWRVAIISVLPMVAQGYAERDPRRGPRARRRDHAAPQSRRASRRCRSRPSTSPTIRTTSTSCSLRRSMRCRACFAPTSWTWRSAPVSLAASRRGDRGAPPRDRERPSVAPAALPRPVPDRLGCAKRRDRDRPHYHLMDAEFDTGQPARAGTDPARRRRHGGDVDGALRRGGG